MLHKVTYCQGMNFAVVSVPRETLEVTYVLEGIRYYDIKWIAIDGDNLNIRVSHKYKFMLEILADNLSEYVQSQLGR